MKEILFRARIPNEAHCYRISSAMIHRHGGMMKCWSCKRIVETGAIVTSMPQQRGHKVRCLACSLLTGVRVLELPHELDICKCGHSARSVETFKRHVLHVHRSHRYSAWLVEKGMSRPSPPITVTIGRDGAVE